MSWATKQKCGSSSQKLVLLMLADHCNGNTGQCNPSQKLLAEECEMSVSSLKAQIKALAEKKLLTVLPRFSEGVQLPNQYRLNFDCSKADSEGVRQILTGGQADYDGGVGQILTGGQADSGYKPVTEPVTIETVIEPKEGERKNERGNERNENKGRTEKLVFKTPTIGEIEEYATENGLQIDAGRFFDYYESNGWTVGKSKMKNWQATVRNWTRRDFNNGGGNATHQQSNKKLSAVDRARQANGFGERTPHVPNTTVANDARVIPCVEYSTSSSASETIDVEQYRHSEFLGGDDGDVWQSMAE